MMLLTTGYGWGHTLTQMGWFFTKAALLTFGGAYAVLPSFIFILVGGPLVESTHGKLKFTAPLTAISGAVVGVILNLAMFFGYHVLWPEGFTGAFDWTSVLIALMAAIALFRFKRNVIEVISACAVIGFILKTFF
ncbi:chromate transporter [Nitrosomonas aestuarii]|nr:chromate transporter [Nitrosomonas aestuarii]